MERRFCGIGCGRTGRKNGARRPARRFGGPFFRPSFWRVAESERFGFAADNAVGQLCGVGRRLSRRSLHKKELIEDGVCFDFEEHLGGDEFAYLDHGGGGANVLEEFAVGAADIFPVRDISDEHARSDYIFEAGTGTDKCSFDVFNDLDGLRVGISDAHDFSIRAGRGRTGNADVIADAHRAGIANDGFPGSPGRNVLSWHIGIRFPRGFFAIPSHMLNFMEVCHRLD